MTPLSLTIELNTSFETWLLASLGTHCVFPNYSKTITFRIKVFLPQPMRWTIRKLDPNLCAWIQVLLLPVIRTVTLGKLLGFSVPYFSWFEVSQVHPFLTGLW